MKQIQEDLIKYANQISDKYRALKRGKFMEEEEEKLLTFQPLITSLQPLQALAREDKIDINKPIVARTSGASTPLRMPFLASITAPRTNT